MLDFCNKYKEEIMDSKNLLCKNCKCSKNSEYEKEIKDVSKAFCKMLTENDLKNKTFCEERQW